MFRRVVLKHFFLEELRSKQFYWFGPVILKGSFLSSSSSLTWEWVRNANFQAPPQTYWIRYLGGGAQQPVL